MSQPMKKIEQAPESYSPKVKPVILSLAEQKTNRVRTSNGGKYIDNVPPIQWGEWHECTYSGCMMLLLNALGADATYEQIMGLTGSCYRVSMAYEWDYGSNIVDITYHCLGINTGNTVSRAYGIECYQPTDENTRDIQIRNSIDSGVPVLVLGGRCEPEWSIVLGYEVEDGSVKYFGRSYFDKDAADDELHTKNRYVLTKDYPGERFIKLFDKSYDPLLPLESLRISLETCLEMFKPHEKFGYDAYDRMIRSFEDNEFTSDWNNEANIYAILITLTDARRAASVYLKESAELLAGENKEKLLRAASLYQEMFQTLMGLKEKDNFDKNVIINSKQTRDQYAAKLRSCLELERQAHGIIREILANW